MKCRLKLIIILLALPFVAAAQENSPDAPEIVLPTALLRVESIPFDQVETILPGSSQIVLPDMVVPMPELQEMDVKARILLPELELDLGSVESSIFSTGSITAGTRNLIEGRLGVFKLGQDPRFRLTFLHNGMDGYGTEPAGTGFFMSRQQLDGWLGSSAGPVEYEASLAFTESQDGLQRFSNTYHSSVIRLLDGSISARFRPDELVGVYASVEAGTANRRFTVSSTGSTPESDGELFIRPEARVAIELPVFSIGIDIDYGFQQLSPGEAGTASALQDASIGLSFDAQPHATWDLHGSAAAGWIVEENRFEYPFVFGLQYRHLDWLSLGLDVGRRVQTQHLSTYWNTLPLLSVPAAPAISGEWFSALRGQADLLDYNLRVLFGLEYVSYSGRLNPGRLRETSVQTDPDSDQDTETEVFPVLGHPVAYDSGNEILLDLETIYQFSRLLRGELLYTAAIPLADSPANSMRPQHSASSRLHFTSENGLHGSSVDLSLPFYSDAVMPFLDLTGFTHVSEGVVLRAGLIDVLSLLINGNRYVFGQSGQGDNMFSPFIEPGFRLQLTAEITL
ncbi:hypothetical protein [Spirochaeta dissipatitropha]